MSGIAIRVENLSKLYRTSQRERYQALLDALTGAIYAPFCALPSALNGRRSVLSTVNRKLIGP